MHTICVVCVLLKSEYFVWVVKELWTGSVCVCVYVCVHVCVCVCACACACVLFSAGCGYV